MIRPSIASRRGAAYDKIASALVEAFDASGVEYTSRAAILSVIDDRAMPLIVRAEREDVGIGPLRTRRALNLACDRIHERWRKGREQ